MRYYVFALVDQRPAGRLGRGLGGAVSSRAIPGGFAVVERRDDVPPAEFGTLTRHDAVIARAAAAVPAILPVRFGTLLQMDEIEDALAERQADLAEGFDLVRGRVQFTWRRGAAASRRAPAARVGLGVTDLVPPPPGSGAAYLRRAARASHPAPPALFKTVGAKLRPLIAAERYQPAAPPLPDSLYHLVNRGDSRRYRLIAESLAAATPILRLSGGWAPFAFTPDLL